MAFRLRGEGGRLATQERSAVRPARLYFSIDSPNPRATSAAIASTAACSSAPAASIFSSLPRGAASVMSASTLFAFAIVSPHSIVISAPNRFAISTRRVHGRAWRPCSFTTRAVRVAEMTSDLTHLAKQRDDLAGRARRDEEAAEVGVAAEARDPLEELQVLALVVGGSHPEEHD